MRHYGPISAFSVDGHGEQLAVTVKMCPDTTVTTDRTRNTVEIDALFFFPSPAMSSPIFWSRHCGVPAQYSPWVKAKALIPSCPRDVQVVVRWDAMQEMNVLGRSDC